MKRTFSIILVVIAILKLAQCLICNGDFEAYTIPPGSQSVGVSPNYSCWYERSGGQFEVQKKTGSKDDRRFF